MEEASVKKQVLVITEVFYPEEFLINDVVDGWNNDDTYAVKVVTRNPSYPFGRIYDGFKNKFYQKLSYGKASVYRYHVIQGYKGNTRIKILNYLWNALLSSIIVLIKFRKEKNVFVYHTGPLTVALPAILLKKMTGAKVTIWSQDIWPDTIFAYGIKSNKTLSKLVTRYVAWVYRNCDNILVSSRSFEQVISQYTSQEIIFVPNWANKVFERTATDNQGKSKDGKEFNFSFAGNIGKVQNLEIVIKSFANWQRRYDRTDAVLNIYGDGSNLDNLKTLVASQSISNVKFWGRVPISNMPSVYENSDVLVISLDEESIFRLYLPAKFSSYLSSGKPILGVVGGEVQRLIEENNLGAVASPSDEEEIIRGFEDLYHLDEKEKEKILFRSKELFGAMFSPSKNIEKIEACLWG